MKLMFQLEVAIISHHASPSRRQQIPGPFADTTSRTTPPSSPLRPSDAPAASTPSRRSMAPPIPANFSPHTSANIVPGQSPSHSPRESQSFDELARSSLSASHISESEGDLTIDAIEAGWESDESGILGGEDLAGDLSGRNDLSAVQGGDQMEKEEEEGDESVEESSASIGKEDPEEAEDVSREEFDRSFESQVEGVTCSAEESFDSNDGEETSNVQDAPYDGLAEGSAQADQPDIMDQQASDHQPASETSAPVDNTLIVSLVTRIVKIERDDDREESGSEEEDSLAGLDDVPEADPSDDEDMEEDGDMEEDEDLRGSSEGLEEEEHVSSKEDPATDVSQSTFVSTPMASVPTVTKPSTPVQVHIALSTTPLHTPPQSMLAHQYRQVDTPNLINDEIPPEPFVARPQSPILQASSSLSPRPRRRSETTIRPSGLSHLITGNTPDASPAHQSAPTIEAATVTPPIVAPSGQLSESPSIEEGVSIRSAGKSLLAEMARASGKGKEKSLRGVVEVSSLDPRAAARAAAILKLVSVSCFILQ